MIKFFRRIRQNLLMQNKTGKPAYRTGRYFKYAIGEILLVIIGILIAVSINGWNEDRKLAIEEQSLLKDLKQEMDLNLKTLKIVIAQHEESLEAAEEMMILFKDRDAFNKMPTKTFSELTWKMEKNSTYDPQNGILNSLINSGRLSLFSNKELKYLLASFKELTVDAFEDTHAIQKQRPPLVHKFYLSGYEKKNGKIISYNFKQIYDNEEFRLYTWLYFIVTRKGGLTEERNLKLELEKIMNLINQEIKK
ncbi:hypothetical protein K8354_04445 [Polaribacter litorisediminis]|uniref:DUF6090 family protein n=1 Tax=Polaribacter litorisediminis TaxID=1908341 RepID=UPI001CBE8339|nr:DUF6090 family protein [Polaribacter litorisediminis]UAM99080.1 hypothetical protein K8354_04445 [Polaribacter litorisediminis]